MAIFSLNEVFSPAVTQRYGTWRLARELINAGWEVWGSSDGTTFSTSGVDHWGTYSSSAQLANSWIALKRPGVDQGVCFHNGTAGTNQFRATYTKSGWSSSGVNATTPPLAVGVTAYLRGSAGGMVNFHWCHSSYTSNTVHVLNIMCQDAATDGSFYLIGWGDTPAAYSQYIVQFSILDLPATYAPDTHVWYVGSPTGGIADNGVFGYSSTSTHVPGTRPFYGFGENGSFVNLMSQGFVGDDGRKTITHIRLYEYATGYAIGFPKWIRNARSTGHGFTPITSYGTNRDWWIWPDGGDSVQPAIPWLTADRVYTNNTGSYYSIASPGILCEDVDLAVINPALDVPTANIVVGGMSPHEPRETVTFEYSYAGAGGSDVLRLVIYAYGDDGKSVLVYDGNAVPDAFPAPTENFEVVDNEDDGNEGFIQLRPIEGKHWPLELCNFVLLVKSDVDTSALYTTAATIDTADIPTGPTIEDQTPTPGAIINNATPVSFDILGAVVTIVYVQRYGEQIWETVYNNSTFAPIYAGSTREAITGGYRYTVYRQGGWGRAPTFTATAVDADGNIL